MPVATVGDTATAELDVTSEDIERYAALTGDDNPLHVDPDYAADAVFGEPVAHGMLTAGAVSAALADLPGDVVYVSQDLEFTKPVTPGETLTAEVEVVEALPDDQLRVLTTAAGADGTVLQGEAIVMSLAHGWGRRSVPAAAYPGIGPLAPSAGESDRQHRRRGPDRKRRRLCSEGSSTSPGPEPPCGEHHPATGPGGCAARRRGRWTPDDLRLAVRRGVVAGAATCRLFATHRDRLPLWLPRG